MASALNRESDGQVGFVTATAALIVTLLLPPAFELGRSFSPGKMALSAVLVLGLGIYCCLRFWPRDVRFFAPGQTVSVELGLGVGVALTLLSIAVIVSLIPWAAGVPSANNNASPRPTGLLGYLMAAAPLVVLGVYEEVVFRGILLRYLTRNWGLIVGLFGGAGLFSLAHLYSVGISPELIRLFAYGLLFGAVALWRKGLAAVAAGHVLLNALAAV